MTKKTALLLFLLGFFGFLSLQFFQAEMGKSELYEEAFKELHQQLPVLEVKKPRVLVHFWASWCEPCQEEFPLLNRLAEKSKISIVGINLDQKREDFESAIKKFELQFPSFHDEQGTISKLFNVQALPQSFFLKIRNYFLTKKEC